MANPRIGVFLSEPAEDDGEFNESLVEFLAPFMSDVPATTLCGGRVYGAWCIMATNLALLIDASWSDRAILELLAHTLKPRAAKLHRVPVVDMTSAIAMYRAAGFDDAKITTTTSAQLVLERMRHLGIFFDEDD